VDVATSTVDVTTDDRDVATDDPDVATGGVDVATGGNELLTASAGAVLFVLLAVIGATIIAMRPLLSAHLFVGMLLIGPLALKMSTTGYRFVRYYTRNPAYRAKGAPPTPLRLIAPIVVVSTVVVFASGVALLFAGPSSRDSLLPIHKVSFIVWVVFTSLHVLAHLPATARALRLDFGSRIPRRPHVSGRAARGLSLVGALAAGAVLAVAVIPQFGPWERQPHGLHAHLH
jgi:hypothetical protein